MDFIIAVCWIFRQKKMNKIWILEFHCLFMLIIESSKKFKNAISDK